MVWHATVTSGKMDETDNVAVCDTALVTMPDCIAVVAMLLSSDSVELVEICDAVSPASSGNRMCLLASLVLAACGQEILLLYLLSTVDVPM